MSATIIQYDIIVVGAGIAGSAAAVAFARQGRKVLLLERSLEAPDRIVGELLQPGGVDALTELGLASCLDGIDATPIEGYHLYWKGEEASFWFCDMDGKKPEGRSFHHGKFVTKLREAAAAFPNVTLLEATATEILRDGETAGVKGVLCSRADGGPEKVGNSRLSLPHSTSDNGDTSFSDRSPFLRMGPAPTFGLSSRPTDPRHSQDSGDSRCWTPNCPFLDSRTPF